MSVDAELTQPPTPPDDDPWKHLRATPEERARVMASAPPFDAEAWLRDAVPPSVEELADLDDWLKEREEERGFCVQREQERLDSDR